MFSCSSHSISDNQRMNCLNIPGPFSATTAVVTAAATAASEKPVDKYLPMAGDVSHDARHCRQYTGSDPENKDIARHWPPTHVIGHRRSPIVSKKAILSLLTPTLSVNSHCVSLKRGRSKDIRIRRQHQRPVFPAASCTSPQMTTQRVP